MVQKVKVNSSNEHWNNASDESRVYDMSANVNISGSAMNSVESGEVVKDGIQVANFNLWNENHMNITYQGVDVEERNAINVAVDTFVSELKEAINN